MRYMPHDKRQLANDVKRFVDKERNYRNPYLTMSMVADALGIARSSLIKVMSEEIGMPFAHYINKVRIHHARHFVVMNKGRNTMEHIALLCGYATLATFNRKYKQEYGELPSDTERRIMGM
ncbi:MAG: helix-turn-helix transcriptional regulator [Prevotella sp.]|nr:helix-turn-helix transcriptional regulator [Candidatus Prevotella equi]